MLVCIAFYPGDREQTIRLAKWMNELGPYPKHEMLIVRDVRCQPVPELGESFGKKDEMLAKAEMDGWPQSANYFFRTATAILANRSDKFRHFLWLEPDAIPLTEGWLDKIEQEYLNVALPAKKQFLGDRVEVRDIPLHMSGIGVYPNPIYHLAGEAYRAADEAWDMAAKDQILPNAHFTDLIEHAWKHPTFASMDEIRTQIDPKTVLFHSSKDGSLIDLLRQQRSGASALPTGMCPASSGGVKPSPLPDLSGIGTDQRRNNADPIIEGAHKPAQTPIYDIFVRTYPVDYPWLQYCLRSIRQYATGFRKVWIISPEPYPGKPWDIPGVGVEIEWKVMNEESQDGYLSQQIHKLYADHITNYEPDYILHLDSDVLLTRPVSPKDFFTNGKLTWYYTPYEHTETPWKPITEKFIGHPVAYEFMRRLPMMLPRWAYDGMRKFCWDTHHLILSDYIRKQPHREFSEFNAIGAYVFHDSGREKEFYWVDTTKTSIPEPCARQFYSWSGLSIEVKQEIQTILEGKLLDQKFLEKKGVANFDESPAENGSVDEVPEDGYESPGDHVRWLAAYIEGSPSRRQYVLNQLDRVGLKALRRGRKQKKKEKI